MAAGEGAGDADPNGENGPGSSSDGHTWEDRGEPDPSSAAAGERSPAVGAPQQIDDFRRLYAAQRLEGARSLVAGVDAALDPSGRVDELPIRLTGGDERATAPTIELPPSYRAQATEAIEGETVPPAYRRAVREYFDDMR